MHKLLEEQGTESVKLSIELYMPSLQRVEQYFDDIVQIASECEDISSDIFSSLLKLQTAIYDYRDDCVKAIIALQE